MLWVSLLAGENSLHEQQQRAQGHWDKHTREAEQAKGEVTHFRDSRA